MFAARAPCRQGGMQRSAKPERTNILSIEGVK